MNKHTEEQPHTAMKQIIRISHYANDEPQVQLPKELQGQVEIQFVDLMEQDFLILEHAGVKGLPHL